MVLMRGSIVLKFCFLGMFQFNQHPIPTAFLSKPPYVEVNDSTFGNREYVFELSKGRRYHSSIVLYLNAFQLLFNSR